MSHDRPVYAANANAEAATELLAGFNFAAAAACSPLSASFLREIAAAMLATAADGRDRTISQAGLVLRVRDGVAELCFEVESSAVVWPWANTQKP